MKVIITESQFQLLELFANTSQYPQVIDKVLRPLEKLKECKFTPDGKYVVYRGKAYKTANGEEVPINESWTLSDILHTGADVLSVGLDFVIPGSGAVVDTLNALSYIIEAQFKSNEEKDSLYLMAAITFGFVILAGPLQAIAAPLKRSIKTGEMASPIVVKGLKIIAGSLDTLLVGIPTRVNVALKSPLAKNILGSYSGKISGFITAFTTRTKSMLGKLTGPAGSGKAVGNVAGSSVDNAVKLLPAPAVDNAIKILPISAGPVSKEVLPAITSKSSSLSKLSDVALGNNGGSVLSKLGFTSGKTYGFGKKTFKIKETAGEYVDFVEVVDGGKEVIKKMKVWDFLKTYIINPSAKLTILAVPVITKATVRLFNNGTLNTEELNKMENINSDQTQKDLDQLSTLVAEYEGESGKYTVNNKAKIVQQSLMKLGYPLPRFKDDGKFGPETLNALKKFQQDNGLTSSIGKMDKLTARKLSELLKSKNISGSEELQNSLNSM
jgi:hypothetical protein